MRRPSPLPPPASPPAEDVRAARSPRRGSGGATGTDVDAAEVGAADVEAARIDALRATDATARRGPSTDALVPFGADEGPRRPRPPVDLVADQGGGTDTADAPIGVRDVWRAARARRRALRAEVRRFTVRQRRRRLVWIGVAASVVALILVTLGAAYSPLFAVEKISVVGASQLDPAAVEAALDGQIGTPLPLVSESDVKAALVGFPLVETYSLEARPPHELVVRIVERTPIGVIQTRAGYTVVDAAGVALSTTATAPAGEALLEITGGVASDAFIAAGTVMRSLPEDIRAQVTAVSATTPDDVTLTLGGTNTSVVWGSADESAMKAVSLAATMKARPPASVSSYDVSSPEAVVVG